MGLHTARNFVALMVFVEKMKSAQIFHWGWVSDWLTEWEKRKPTLVINWTIIQFIWITQNSDTPRNLAKQTQPVPCKLLSSSPSHSFNYYIAFVIAVDGGGCFHCKWFLSQITVASTRTWNGRNTKSVVANTCVWVCTCHVFLFEWHSLKYFHKITCFFFH